MVAVAAVLIASKFEEYLYVIISDLLILTGNAYTAEMIKDMECVILNTLQFQIIRPTPLDFLRRFSRAADNNDITHTCAKYLIELSTLDHVLVAKKPSLIAASAMYLARRMCLSQPYWDETMTYYSGYTEENIKEVARSLRYLHQYVCTSECKYDKVKKKYQSNHYMSVSQIPSCAEF